MHWIKLSLAAALGVSTFGGCGSATPALTPQQQQNVSSFDISQIDLLGQKINKAINDDDLLVNAPVSIALAQEHYESAQVGKEKALQMAAYIAGEKALEHAYASKGFVIKYLDDIADIDRRMQKAQTQVVYTGRYHDFQDDYGDLIRLIDKDKITEALADKKEVLEDAKDLYGDTVVYNHMSEAYRVLDNMEDEDLDEAAPTQFEKAEKQYEASRFAIKQDPDNLELVKKMARLANEAAKYAQTLGKDVAALAELDEDEYESFFNKLHRRISTLNQEEAGNAILPYPMYEKISRLQDAREVVKPAGAVHVSVPAVTPAAEQMEHEEKVAGEKSVAAEETSVVEMLAATEEDVAEVPVAVEEELLMEASAMSAEETAEPTGMQTVTEASVEEEVQMAEEMSTIPEEEPEATELTKEEVNKVAETVADNTPEVEAPLL